jgi:hypothetical protein
MGNLLILILSRSVGGCVWLYGISACLGYY